MHRRCSISAGLLLATLALAAQPVPAAQPTVDVDVDGIAMHANRHAQAVLLKALREHLRRRPYTVARADHFPHYRELSSGGRLPLTHYLCGELVLRGGRGGEATHRPFYAATVIDPFSGEVEQGATIVSGGDTASPAYLLFERTYATQCQERTEAARRKPASLLRVATKRTKRLAPGGTSQAAQRVSEAVADKAALTN